MCIPKSKDISISIEDLAIGYRTKGVSKVVACNIQAQLGRGEMTCLIGSNGAGKSTLLKALIDNSMLEEGIGESKFSVIKEGKPKIGYLKQIEFEI